jgi:hypothetical protein
VVERCAQAAIVIVLESDEAEWLQHTVGHLAHRTEHFGHGVYRTSLRLKGNLDKVTLRQGLRQTQQTSGRGNSLEFGFSAAAVF